MKNQERVEKALAAFNAATDNLRKAKEADEGDHIISSINHQVAVTASNLARAQAQA